MVEIFTSPNADDKRKRYEIKNDCYYQGKNNDGDDNFTCTNCYGGKKRNNSLPNLNQDQINQLQQEINQLESITNRTPEQEQRLKELKKQLEELEKKQGQEPSKSNKGLYIGLAIGGVLAIGLVIYFTVGSKKPKRRYCRTCGE
jgi:TolA-binding protein